LIEDIQDPLKPLSAVLEPDPRHTQFVLKLPDLHAVLSRIVLAEHVPLNVRQLFETAKNVSLYSWFVYRFHQVAELVAYSALEMALRERAGFVEWAALDSPRAPGLKRLLEQSKKEGWLKSERFPSFRMLATERARHAQVISAISVEVPAETTEINEPTEDEIRLAMHEIDIVQILIDSAPETRNRLAHGSSTLSPRSVHTLGLVAEAINQLFIKSV
jgi:hypothetical protein